MFTFSFFLPFTSELSEFFEHAVRKQQFWSNHFHEFLPCETAQVNFTRTSAGIWNTDWFDCGWLADATRECVGI